MSAKAAVDRGDKRYHGAVCAKHPELNGERNAKNRGCLGCNREKMKKRRAENIDYYLKVERVSWAKWYKANRVKACAQSRKRRTGMDEHLVQNLLAFQAGRCAICHKPLGKSPHADHSHDTGTPRGLLCGHCNRAEGLIRKSGLDPAEFGKRFAMYLKHPPAEGYLKARMQ